MDKRRVLRTALRAGLPFGVCMSVFFTLQHGIPGGPIAGVVAGALFGVLLGVIQEAQAKKLAVAGDRYEGEPLLHQGPANHWRNAEARGGWLLLTERRLVFRTHGKNLQNAPLELSLDLVRAVEPARTLGVIPNGVRVVRTDGGEERFVVGDRATWLAKFAAIVPRS
jgi:hypothetical protein